MYARAEVMYRVLIDYVSLTSFENGSKATHEYAAGPYMDIGAAKAAVTRAKKGWPFNHYYVPNGNVGLAGRVCVLYEAEITNIRFERCEPKWTEMKV